MLKAQLEQAAAPLLAVALVVAMGTASYLLRSVDVLVCSFGGTPAARAYWVSVSTASQCPAANLADCVSNLDVSAEAYGLGWLARLSTVVPLSAVQGYYPGVPLHAASPMSAGE